MCENIDRMHNWFLDYYDTSTINTWPHQALAIMARPLIENHLKDNATLVARHNAIPVPIHWQGQVHSDLVHDELLGLIERVHMMDHQDEPSTCSCWMSIAKGRPTTLNSHFILHSVSHATSGRHWLMLGMGITACRCENLIVVWQHSSLLLLTRTIKEFFNGSCHQETVTIADSMLFLLTLRRKSTE